MKKFIYICISFVFITSSLYIMFKPVLADAFNQNNIMDDAVFDDYNSMTASQIQGFLGSFPSSCLTNYQAPYPTDYWTYGGNVLASTVIKRVGDLWQINPKVILATLEKEESLVSGSAGCASWRYNSAVGMGCPDGGTCPTPEYAGFSKQVTKGMWQLMFNKERSYGNLAWGDNGNSEYYGFMTKGYRSRKTGLPLIYYDGYATIDSTRVYMSNGATAALYTYTPHFHGNQNFQAIFNQWFGSTHLPQPIGAMLYRQSSNGNIFLIANDKRFYISPAAMINYNIGSYGTISATDNTINSITNGGALTNVIRDDNGDVYLVNNGYRHYMTPTVCTNWAIGCFVVGVGQNLGYNFINVHLKSGINLNSAAKYGGVYYQMSSGTRLPYADTQSFTSSGFSTSNAINANAINITQTLGKLQLKTAGIIKFAPKSTIYYFNGTDFYTIPDMSIYSNWNLGSIHTINAPLSSYNTSDNVIPVANLSYWYEASDGGRYVISNGNRIRITISQQILWSNAVYMNGLDRLVGSLPRSTLGNFIKSGVSFYQLFPSIGEKRYITNMDDYVGLGGDTSNTTRLNNILGGSINSGSFAFPNGRLVKVDGGSVIYVYDNERLLHVPSMSVLNAYNFDTTKMKTYQLADLAEYGKLVQLQSGELPDSSAVIPYGDLLLKLSATQVVGYGMKLSELTQISKPLTARAEQKNVTQFWRNADNGNIYYGSGGALHHISSLTKYYQLGGKLVPLTSADSLVISLFTIGNSV